ncbi:MAG: AraC family chitin signaling transcriptional activator, partial [Saprospiraceae bacterium]
MNFANIFLTVLLLVIAQHSSAQELYYDQYTTNDGLPSNTIYEIVQDSNGLLWMGTENGLVSYDGVTFERFTDSRLMDNDIIELEISK